jgi:hypothetical protein
MSLGRKEGKMYSRYCTNCGAELVEGASFCTSYGARVGPPTPLRCASCGAEVGEGVSFCTRCGTPVTAAAAGTSRQPRKTSGETRSRGGSPLLRDKEAAELARELRGLRSASRVATDVLRFTTTDGSQYVVATESAEFRSVGTVIQGAIPSTVVIKDCVPGWMRHKSKFHPLPSMAGLLSMRDFDVNEVYKRKIGWDLAIERLNADYVLEGMIQDVPTSSLSGSGGTYRYFRDDPKNPLTCRGQLVPQGSVTLAALIWMPKGDTGSLIEMVPHPKGPYYGIASCVKALGRIACVIVALPRLAPTYGPSIGWNIIPHLRQMAGLSPGETQR